MMSIPSLSLVKTPPKTLGSNPCYKWAYASFVQTMLNIIYNELLVSTYGLAINGKNKKRYKHARKQITRFLNFSFHNTNQCYAHLIIQYV
jgi:hypothetical protein